MGSKQRFALKMGVINPEYKARDEKRGQNEPLFTFLWIN